MSVDFSWGYYSTVGHFLGLLGWQYGGEVQKAFYYNCIQKKALHNVSFGINNSRGFSPVGSMALTHEVAMTAENPHFTR